MSEWYDTQKKSNGNICKLVQEQMDKVNPLTELSTEESKRFAKL